MIMIDENAVFELNMQGTLTNSYHIPQETICWSDYNVVTHKKVLSRSW